MFERYTDQARRAVFVGRYWASQQGSGVIEPEHLLLALLDEKCLARRVLDRHEVDIDALRDHTQLVVAVRGVVSTSVDIPLSTRSKRVLEFAAEQAGTGDVESGHILLGVLLEEGPAAALLQEHDISIHVARAYLSALGPEATRPGRR